MCLVFYGSQCIIIITAAYEQNVVLPKTATIRCRFRQQFVASVDGPL